MKKKEKETQKETEQKKDWLTQKIFEDLEKELPKQRVHLKR